MYNWTALKCFIYKVEWSYFVRRFTADQFCDMLATCAVDIAIRSLSDFISGCSVDLKIDGWMDGWMKGWIDAYFSRVACVERNSKNQYSQSICTQAPVGPTWRGYTYIHLPRPIAAILCLISIGRVVCQPWSPFSDHTHTGRHTQTQTTHGYRLQTRPMHIIPM